MLRPKPLPITIDGELHGRLPWWHNIQRALELIRAEE
jgi:hypothetical protein